MPKHKKEFKSEIEFGQEEAMTFCSLEELASRAAKTMIQRALEHELEEFMKESGPEVVRNGYHRPRSVLTGAGPIEDVRVPRTRNRTGGDNFTSAIIPPYMRKSITVAEAIPLFYLYGISEKDIASAVQALFGDTAKGLSASSVSRMKKAWEKSYGEWKNRRFDGKSYCYIWVDGIYFNVQGSKDKLCTLVMIGANSKGEKELIAVEEGYRETSESWGMMLRELKERGLENPKLFIGDGAMGFWKASREVFPKARSQKCWVHKIRNVLAKLPKVMHPKAKELLHEIYNAPSKEEALKAFKRFKDALGAKYPNAVASVEDNLDELLEFYNFPAEHWIHIRSTNIIESTFSTVRLRTKKTRGCGSRNGILVMVYKLLENASTRWRRLKGQEKIELVMDGIVFKNGEPAERAA